MAPAIAYRTRRISRQKYRDLESFGWLRLRP
jgi:hypothetical protein